MQSTVQGLFDRFDLIDEGAPVDGRARSSKADAWTACITYDLEALLNTRCALAPEKITRYPELSKSVINFGLIDFAGMCMTSDTDRQRICEAVRQAIVRHEPRLDQVSATLEQRKGAINRVDFVITAQARHLPEAGAMQFSAVFEPALQRYSVRSSRVSAC